MYRAQSSVFQLFHFILHIQCLTFIKLYSTLTVFYTYTVLYSTVSTRIRPSQSVSLISLCSIHHSIHLTVFYQSHNTVIQPSHCISIHLTIFYQSHCFLFIWLYSVHPSTKHPLLCIPHMSLLFFTPLAFYYIHMHSTHPYCQFHPTQGFP